MNSNGGKKTPSLETILKGMVQFHKEKGWQLNGMTAAEIKMFETTIGCPLPKCLRQLFLVADKTTNPLGGNFKYYYDPNAVKEIMDFIQNLLGNTKDCFIPFNDELNGDLYCLKSGDDPGQQVFFVDHEQATAKPVGNFTEHIAGIWNEAKEWSKDKHGKRYWHSTFSFNTYKTDKPVITPEDKIIAALTTYLGARFRDWGQIQEDPNSEANRTERIFFVGDDVFRLIKQEGSGWLAPRYGIMVSDPEDDMKNGKISKFRKAFKAAGLLVEEIEQGFSDRDFAKITVDE